LTNGQLNEMLSVKGRVHLQKNTKISQLYPTTLNKLTPVHLHQGQQTAKHKAEKYVNFRQQFILQTK